MSRRTLWWLVLAAPALAAGAGLAWESYRLPSFEEVRAGYRASDLILLDRNGEVLHEVRVDPQRRRLAWTPLAEVSPALPGTVLAAEDRRFYRHRGVDWRAAGAAVLDRLRRGPERGASTVTMQLVGVLDEGLAAAAGRRTVTQKFRQAAAAMALELTWTKSEILEAYLNLVSFRGELQGVRSASRGLFRKDPHGLTAAESAILAALIRAPEAPPARVLQRALGLADNIPSGILAEDLAVAAARLESPYRLQGQVQFAPHAARLVTAARSEVTAGAVRTSLDFALQVETSELVRRKLLELADRNVNDGAVLVAEVSTGEILAYVANGGTVSSARHVDGIRAPRQAGSALKPLLYGVALESGLLTPATLVDDSPFNVMVTGGIYRPGNYDRRFRGPVTVRTALASSLNIPAVRVLEMVGTEPFVGRLESFGFRSLRGPEYYGPSLALGAADVTLWDMVTAYLALARGGEAVELRWATGEAEARRRVLSSEAAFLVSDILSDREARGATFDLESPLATSYWSAVKTGTSKDMRDNWCVGYSTRYVVGVWVGNFSGEPMWDVSGVTGAAPIWLETMNRLHRGFPSEPPAVPPGLERASIRFEDPMREVEEWFLKGTAPSRIRRVAPSARHRIAYPPDGTIVAVDPDIPPRNQAVFFEALPAGADLFWELNGERLGPADGLAPWPPRTGAHRLRLLSRRGEALDEVRFFVRGPAETRPD